MEIGQANTDVHAPALSWRTTPPATVSSSSSQLNPFLLSCSLNPSPSGEPSLILREAWLPFLPLFPCPLLCSKDDATLYPWVLMPLSLLDCEFLEDRDPFFTSWYCLYLNSVVAKYWKRPVFIPVPKKGNPKEFSYYRTIALISHASKVMLKILQARLQQYVNWELPDVQAGFRNGRGTRDQIANISWIIEKAREF